MDTITTPNYDRLFVVFKTDLKKEAGNNDLAGIYNHLFALVSDENLLNTLTYLYQLQKGLDSYFKEDGIDGWFGVFHKSLRQGDFFQDCFQNKKVELLTKDEIAELKFLRHQVAKEGFSKTKGKKPDKMFNDTYNRYLDLTRISKRQVLDESINGHLDMILWSMIHVDKDDVLYKIFLGAFDEFDFTPKKRVKREV